MSAPTTAAVALERTKELAGLLRDTVAGMGGTPTGQVLTLVSSIEARLIEIVARETGTKTERHDGGAGLWVVVLVHDKPGPFVDVGIPSPIAVGLFEHEADYPCFIWSHGRPDLRHIYVERLEASPEGQARAELQAGLVARIVDR